jgi:hypothetical protein
MPIRALGLLTCEVLLEGAADDFAGGRVLLGGGVVESPAESPGASSEKARPTLPLASLTPLSGARSPPAGLARHKRHRNGHVH